MNGPTFMAYELRLLWHTNPPPFMPFEPFLLGVGVVFNLLIRGKTILSSAGAGSCGALPMRLPNTSPVLEKNRAPIGPETLSSTGAGVWRKAPARFPDSNSTLDRCQFAKTTLFFDLPRSRSRSSGNSGSSSSSSSSSSRSDCSQ